MRNDPQGHIHLFNKLGGANGASVK